MVLKIVSYYIIHSFKLNTVMCTAQHYLDDDDDDDGGDDDENDYEERHNVFCYL